MTFGCAGNLPDEDAGFVGRLGVLATLRRHLAEARLVTVTGIGGVGKTRTALRLAHETRGRHPDGAWFAGVSAVSDPDQVRPAIAAALGAGSLPGWAEGRRGLLVLDGCERVAPLCAQVAGELLRAAPGLRVLVTSRVPLGVPDERVVALAPMETAGTDNEAVRLFAARARAVQPGFELDELSVASVAELCARLDGIPLAIELAALRLTSMSVNGIAAGLTDRFALLTGPAGQRSLHDALTRSYDLCEPAERLLWAQLSVFAGDFDLEAARFVCGEEIGGLVESLVDKSVLLIRTDYPGTRYKLLGTLAEYGATRLEDSREIRHRHLVYYLVLATRSEQDWSGPRQMYWFERMRQEHDNVRVALEHALDTPDEAALALRLLSSLWFMWVCCGFAGEGRKYLELALRANPEPSPERCKAMWVLSYVRSAQGDSMGAMSMAELCGAEAKRIGDSKALILSSKMRGTAALLQGDLQKASTLLRVAIEFTSDSPALNPGLLPAVVELAIVLTKQGALQEAESMLLECLRICEDRQELSVRSYAYWTLAMTRLEMGQAGEALHDVRKTLRLKRPFHDILGILLALETAAGVYAALERPALSVRLLGALRVNWKAAGLPMLGAPWLTDDHDLLVQKCHKVLGEIAYKEAFDSGMRLDLAQATALALGAPPAGGPAELKIRVAGPAGTALTEDAVERVTRAFGFTMRAGDDGDGGTACGLVFRDDGEGVPAEQRLEEMDRSLREDPPRDPSVARLFTVLRNAGPAVVLIKRTLIVHAQGKITTRRLSTAEQAFLHSRPQLFDDPDGLVAEFRQLATESAVDGSVQAGRDYDEGIAGQLGVPVAVAIKAWGDPEGYEISPNTPAWTKRGYTDCSLAALVIKPPPGARMPARKVIAKVCPPGPLAREYARHRLALDVSAVLFRQKHLAGLLPHPPRVAGTGERVFFQEVAGGSLTDMVQMSELTSPQELVPVFQRVVKGVLSEWNPYPAEVRADVDSGEYLRAELGARFGDDAKLTTWALECGLLEPERSWIWFSGDRSATVLPNPLAMVAGDIAGAHHVQHLRGFSHGDLHHGNVLIPRTAAGRLEPKQFRLIDLTTFEKCASQASDPATLLLSVIARQVPRPGEELFDLIVNGEGDDELIGPLVRFLYDYKLLTPGFHDDWRHQLLLSLLAAALTQCTFADVDEHLKWWFFRLAARCGAAYLHGTRSWDPPETAVPQQLRPEHMRGFEMGER
ncbi:ATP-binding protein [Nonomuraea sp. NPDC059007]|uniref:ATP-binding protein n=1 Tax=Nonomuraea sp. NPDC059007 TaxID=3346692 RepID=UPI0036B312CB